MKRAVIALSLVACGTARAGSSFAVLLDDKRTWTYDLVEGEAGAPTGEQVTLAVAAVDRRGAYTFVDLRATGAGQFLGFTLLIGPKGMREVLTVGHPDPDFRTAFET